MAGAKNTGAGGPGALDRYRKKRSQGRTPEPFGQNRRSAAAPGGLFVVQKHQARHLHFDLRLEIAGVLYSWAVPKGPSADPDVKRLAMSVEPHPLEYGDFEGVIPEGNYGAGTMMLWDRGRWEPFDDSKLGLGRDPLQGIRAGKLLFDLHGHKLKGRWTLFKTHGRGRQDNEWLLMKKPDAFAKAGADAEQYSQRSILSGRTLEQIAKGTTLEKELNQKAARAKAPRRKFDLFKLKPMLAKVAPEPFDGRDWLFEIKYDGFRLLAERAGRQVRLRYRNGEEVTERFPEVVQALSASPHSSFVIDGELVVLDVDGRSNFSRLQSRASGRGAPDPQQRLRNPVVLFAFDLLRLGDRDLRSLPLDKRKRLLEQLVPDLGAVRYCEHLARYGVRLFATAQSLRLEGLIAKQKSSPYSAGRSVAWLKLRVDKTLDAVVVGYKAESSSGVGLGAVALAVKTSTGWRFIGSAGSGLSEPVRKRLLQEFASSGIEEAPVDNPPKERWNWVRPERAAVIRFKQWTRAGRLRHPVWLDFNDDLEAAACHDPLEKRPEDPRAALESERGPETVPTPGRTAPVSDREVAASRPEPQLTNQEKLFWPEEGFTKGDLVEYYRTVAPWLLPYLKDRPVVLTRFPDGIHGKQFFQKDAPSSVPSWVRIQAVWSESANREIRYVVCDNAETLVYLANLATIPFHIAASRFAASERPDWCVLDLDPKEAAFADVTKLARGIHKLCGQIELPHFIKSSGASGLHVLIPLAGQATFDQSKQLAQILCQLLVQRFPDIATLIRTPNRRGGRVYLDALQNGPGKLIAAPLCVRPVAGAQVSMPLRWQDVNARLDPARFHIKNALRRLRRVGDPMEGLLKTEPNLTTALETLAAHLD